MKRYVKANISDMKYFVTNQTRRYFVTNQDYIPLHAQPTNGYTKLQAISRAQREVNECVDLFGGCPEDYTASFHIVDDNFNPCTELDKAI